jgi:hypothetical protein
MEGGFPVKRLLAVAACLLISAPAYAVRSVIVEAQGSACAAKGAVTEKTEQQALNAALTQAHSIAAGHVVVQAGMQGKEAEPRISALYTEAPVRGLQQLKSEKYKNVSGHRCVRVLVRAEVAPEEKSETLLQQLTGDGPGSPLFVQVWPERPVYRQGEKITFFVKGNKTFFGTIVYTDAAEGIVQILPNRYHPAARFEADRVYQLPTDGEFSIVVGPPVYGTERITVYAATDPLDDLADIVPTGLADSSAGDPALKRFKSATGKAAKSVEYVETSATLTTRAGD